MMLYYVVDISHEQLSLYHETVLKHDYAIPVLLLKNVCGDVVEVMSPEGVFQIPSEYLIPCESYQSIPEVLLS